MMDYERLNVYQFALAFTAKTIPLVATISKGNGEFSDQFRRAALSIVLNIAEGAGKFRVPDKRRFYAVARGSAMECGALLDVLNALGLLASPKHLSFKRELRQIVAMLSSLCLGSGKGEGGRV